MTLTAAGHAWAQAHDGDHHQTSARVAEYEARKAAWARYWRERS